jgi:hypothetical protein
MTVKGEIVCVIQTAVIGAEEMRVQKVHASSLTLNLKSKDDFKVQSLLF